MRPHIIPAFRIIALIEAISYLVLLFIAMPLKYIWEFPMAVSVVGMAHGVLFVMFAITLLMSWIIAKWTFARVALLFICSLIPFAPFFLDKWIQKEAIAFKNAYSKKHPEYPAHTR